MHSHDLASQPDGRLGHGSIRYSWGVVPSTRIRSMRAMRCRKFVLGLALLAQPTALAAAAQTTDPPWSVNILLKRDDTVLGMGGVSSISTISSNDSKMWVSLIDTTWSELTRDGCLLRSGFLTLREGTGLLDPEGTTLDEWLIVTMNNNGDLAMMAKVIPPGL